MLILLIHPHYDPACVGWNLRSALVKHTSNTVRHIVFKQVFIGSGELMVAGEDLLLGKGEHKQLFKDLVMKADVLHFSQYDWTEQLEGFDCTTLDLMDKHRRYKIVFQGHGGPWMLNPDEQIKRCESIGATMVTCSPMDEVVLPGAKWMPNVVDLSDPDLSTDTDRSYSGTIVAGMATNAPVYKGGEIVEYVFEYLQNFGYPVRLQFVSHMSRSKSFRVRRRHHLTIDNWTQGFGGMVSFEGFAMAQPSILRMDARAEKNWLKLFQSIPHQLVVGMDDCARVLRGYCKDRDKLKADGLKSLAWLQENYTEKHIAKLWEKFYEVIPQMKGRSLSMAPAKSFKPLVLGNKVTAPVSELVAAEKSQVAQMFDGTARSGSLDGIMGCGKSNEKEMNSLPLLFNRLRFEDKTSILDVGIGVGRLVPVFEDYGFKRVVGIDWSAEMLKECRKAYPEVLTYKMDLCNMAFLDGEFSTAMLMYVLIHNIDDNELAKGILELERVIRNEVIIGQVMEPIRVGVHSGHCKVREVYDIIKLFKKKRLLHFYKDLYEVRSTDNSMVNKVSFLVMK